MSSSYWIYTEWYDVVILVDVMMLSLYWIHTECYKDSSYWIHTEWYDVVIIVNVMVSLLYRIHVKNYENVMMDISCVLSRHNTRYIMSVSSITLIIQVIRSTTWSGYLKTPFQQNII